MFWSKKKRQLKYNDEVVVITGFFEGARGRIRDLIGSRYMVTLEDPTEHRYFDARQLKLVSELETLLKDKG